MMPKRRPPLVLTLRLDAISFATFDDLRRRHFPPERNLVPAHVTLFHALPGKEGERIAAALGHVCSQTPVLDLSFADVRFLGGGVAIEIESPGLRALQKRLALQWEHWLIAQDRRSFRPHITIQNKVDAKEARHLFDRMQDEWQPFSGQGDGLLLWHYLGGPWELARTFTFAKSDDADWAPR